MAAWKVGKHIQSSNTVRQGSFPECASWFQLGKTTSLLCWIFFAQYQVEGKLGFRRQECEIISSKIGCDCEKMYF